MTRKSQLPSINALELMAVSDQPLFEHYMGKIGLPVIGRRNADPTETDVQLESVSAIASAITEDANDNIKLSQYHKSVQKMAESYGYIMEVANLGQNNGPVDRPTDDIQPQTKIEQILARNPNIPVLFISDPQNGDRFEFGPRPKLDQLQRIAARKGLESNVELAGEILNQLDFSCYETEPLIINHN